MTRNIKETQGDGIQSKTFDSKMKSHRIKGSNISNLSSKGALIIND
jgi:hypothetical protein